MGLQVGHPEREGLLEATRSQSKKHRCGEDPLSLLPPPLPPTPWKEEMRVVSGFQFTEDVSVLRGGETAGEVKKLTSVTGNLG